MKSQTLQASADLDSRTAAQFLEIIARSHRGDLNRWFRDQIRRQVEVSPEVQEAFEQVLAEDHEVLERLAE